MAGVAAAPCVPRYAPLPDKDHIRLGQCLFTRTWWASSVLTGERVALPDANDSWIEYDGEGMAEFLSDKSDLLLADELFRYFPFRCSDGAILVGHVKSEGEPPVTSPLDEWRSRWSCGEIGLIVSPMKAVARFSCRVFESWQPARIFVLFSGIYKGCGFSAAKGNVAKWLNRSIGRWEDYLASLGFVGHIQRAPAKRALGAAGSTPDDALCLTRLLAA